MQFSRAIHTAGLQRAGVALPPSGFCRVACCASAVNMVGARDGAADDDGFVDAVYVLITCGAPLNGIGTN